VGVAHLGAQDGEGEWAGVYAPDVQPSWGTGLFFLCGSWGGPRGEGPLSERHQARDGGG
jgi:hypothetical protein